MNPRILGRRGFTLIELLVVMIVAGMAGTALLSIILAETKAFGKRDAWRNARSVARQSLNLLSSEMTMVETSGGVEAATADGKSVTLRVPYVMGLMCSSTGSSTTVSLLPSDSALYSAPGFSGFAYRNGTIYNYVTSGATLTNSGTPGNCSATAAGVATLPAPGSVASNAGRLVTLGGTISPIPARGTPFMLYRRIKYEFKASSAVPGQTGLWRTILTTGATQELAAPFDTTSAFRFYVLNASAPVAAVPATLSDIRGLEIELDGESERIARGDSGLKVFRSTTAIFFQNRPD